MGIFIGNYLNINILVLLLIIGILYVILFYQKTFSYTVLLISFFLGISIFNIKNIEVRKNSLIELKKEIYSAEIIDKLGKNEKNSKYLLTIKKDKNNLKVIAYIPNKYSDYINIGDSIFFNKKINLIPNKDILDDFDYKEFMKLKGITHIVFISNKDSIKVKKSNQNIFYKINIFKENVFKNLQNKGLSSQTVSFTLALIFGDKINLDKNLLENYSDAGVTHILAVSGLHLGMLIIIMTFILSPFDKIKWLKIIKIPLIIFIVWFYAFMVNFSPSILRASIMFTFIIIGNNIKRKANLYNSLFSSAILLLVVNPNNLFEVGFQFSYLALFFIFWIQPLIVNFIKFKNRIIYYFWELISVSISAQIGILPLSLYYFGKLPLLFLLSNIILMPLIGFILFFAIIIILCSLLPYKLEWIYIIYDFVIIKINSIIMFISSFKSMVLDIKLNSSQMVLLFLISFFVILFFKIKKYIYLQISLIFVILFQSLILFNFFKNSNSLELISFNTKNTVVSLKNKTKLYIIKENNNEDDYLNSKIRKYKENNNIKKIEFIETEKDLSITFFDKNILVTQKNIPNTNYDFVFIKNSFTYQKDIDFLKLILDKTNNFNSNIFWKERYKNESFKIHSIHEKGSFYFKY